MKLIASPAFSNRALNPYNWLLYRSIERLGHVVHDGFWIWTDWHADIWHIHWPEASLCHRNPFRAMAGLLVIFLNAGICRLLRMRIVWTVHNLQPHERHWPLLERIFYSLFPRFVDRFIFLSESTRHEALKRISHIRAADSIVIPHGHYRDTFSPPPGKKHARAMIGMPDEATLIVFFGQIRPYKNVPSLIKAFSALSASQLKLGVVGAPGRNKALSADIQGLAAQDPRVATELRHLSDEKLAAWVSAADLIVLPYRDITNSGCAMLALSLNRPVLVPNKGAMSELKDKVGENWVRVYEGALTPQELAAAIKWSGMAAGQPDLEQYSWDSIAEATVAAYGPPIGKAVQ